MHDALASLVAQLRAREWPNAGWQRFRRRTSLPASTTAVGSTTTLAHECGAVARSVGSVVHVSLVLLEVDGLSRVNLQHGHLVGDECLRVVGESIEECLYRPRDFAARYATEQFAVILREPTCKARWAWRSACAALSSGR